MPSPQLTNSDQDFIWQVVLRAADRRGGHAELFSTPLEFEDDGQRIRFHWPDWMQEIRSFICAKYGEKDAQGLLLEIFTEVMSKDQFDARRSWAVDLETSVLPRVSGTTPR